MYELCLIWSSIILCFIQICTCIALAITLGLGIYWKLNQSFLKLSLIHLLKQALKSSVQSLIKHVSWQVKTDSFTTPFTPVTLSLRHEIGRGNTLDLISMMHFFHFFLLIMLLTTMDKILLWFALIIRSSLVL